MPPILTCRTLGRGYEWQGRFGDKISIDYRKSGEASRTLVSIPFTRTNEEKGYSCGFEAIFNAKENFSELQQLKNGTYVKLTGVMNKYGNLVKCKFLSIEQDPN